MIAYVELFSSSFKLALTLWPIISLVLTLPILAFIYHRNHVLSWGSTVTAYVSVLYGVGLLTFTQYPMPDDPTLYCFTHHKPPQLNIFAFIPQILYGGMNDILQLLLNVMFFLPMGFMLYRWAKWRWWIAIPFAFGCSVFIETTQLTGVWGLYPCAYRQFDVDDMLTNTLGGALGYGIGAIYTKFVPQRITATPGTVTQPGFIHRMVSLIIDYLFCFITYLVCSYGFIWAFFECARNNLDGTYSLGPLLVDLSITRKGAIGVAIVAFLIFEVWIPAAHRGRSLGAMYTHMTFETKERHGWTRVLFYVIRSIIMGALFVLAMIGNHWFWTVWLFLLVFYIFARKMPWDYVPGTVLPEPPTLHETVETSPVESTEE